MRVPPAPKWRPRCVGIRCDTGSCVKQGMKWPKASSLQTAAAPCHQPGRARAGSSALRSWGLLALQHRTVRGSDVSRGESVSCPLRGLGGASAGGRVLPSFVHLRCQLRRQATRPCWGHTGPELHAAPAAWWPLSCWEISGPIGVHSWERSSYRAGRNFSGGAHLAAYQTFVLHFCPGSNVCSFVFTLAEARERK